MIGSSRAGTIIIDSLHLRRGGRGGECSNTSRSESFDVGLSISANYTKN